MDFPGAAEEALLQSEPYNAADPKQVNDARKKEARERKEELDYIRSIMKTRAGRKWMYKLIDECRAWGNPIIPGDTHLTYENLGRQNMGKKLFIDINDAAPDQYVAMMMEAKGY